MRLVSLVQVRLLSPRSTLRYPRRAKFVEVTSESLALEKELLAERKQTASLEGDLRGARAEISRLQALQGKLEALCRQLQEQKVEIMKDSRERDAQREEQRQYAIQCLESAQKIEQGIQDAVQKTAGASSRPSRKRRMGP